MLIESLEGRRLLAATNPLPLSTLDGTIGLRLDGVSANDWSGRSVSSAGDVNGDDTLTANQGAGAIDILIGGRGNDILISDGGDDVLIGGEGDDVLANADVAFSGTRRLVGGSGSDTLRLDGGGLMLDLNTIPNNRLLGIEQIDITGSGGNTLTLDQAEVLNLSDESNTLLVRRTSGDTVDIGSGWTQGDDETIGDFETKPIHRWRRTRRQFRRISYRMRAQLHSPDQLDG